MTTTFLSRSSRGSPEAESVVAHPPSATRLVIASSRFLPRRCVRWSEDAIITSCFPTALLAARVPSAQKPRGVQHDHGADDRHQDAGRMEHRAVSGFRKDPDDESADERSDDSETGRHPEAHGVDAGHDRPGDEACYCTDDDHPE